MSEIGEFLAQEAEEAEAVAEAQEQGGKSLQFKVKRFALMALVEKAIPVISSSDALPVLKNFLVAVSPGHLELTASDLELTTRVTTPSVQTSDSGTVALPAKRLRAMLAEAPEGEVSIAVSEGMAHVVAGEVEWAMRIGDHRDYPEQVDLADVQMSGVDRGEFLAALRMVRYAICKDGARPALMMVDICKNVVTASDGARMQRTALKCDVDMKIPAAAVDHVLRLLSSSEAENVWVAEQGNSLIFKVGATTFLAHKTMARFPEIERMLVRPAQANTELLVAERAALLEAIRRVQINADESTSAIGLKLATDRMTLVARDTDGNAAEQPIEVWWKGSPRTLVLNHVFLTEMVNAWSDPKCRLWLGSDTAKKKSLVMLCDRMQASEQGTHIGIIQQMHAVVLGLKD